MPDASRAADTKAVEAAAAASAASGTRGAKMLMLVQQVGGVQTRLMAPNAKGMISAASKICYIGTERSFLRKPRNVSVAQLVDNIVCIFATWICTSFPGWQFAVFHLLCMQC